MKTRRILVMTKCLMALVVVLALLPWVGIAGGTPSLDEQLVRAAARGDLALVKSLLGKGADVNEKGRDGWTPLLAAVSGRDWTQALVFPGNYRKTVLMPADKSSPSGRTDVVQLLIEKGADVNAKDKDGRTALMFAARQVNVAVVKLLLEGAADVNAKDKDGETALMLATRLDPEEFDLSWCATPHEYRTQENYSETFVPNFWKRHAEVVELLKAHGAKTTLIIAAMQGNKEEVKRLLEAGSDINMKAWDGLTPLMGAAAKGHADVAKILIDKGAGINATDKGGPTALTKAIRAGHLDLARMLLDKGADASAVDEYGETALIVAAMKGLIDATKLLLDRGADFTVADKLSRPPLMWAAVERHADVARLLIAHGAEVTLPIAVMLGDAGEVQRLLEAGSDLNATLPSGTILGMALLIRAVVDGNTNVVTLLLDKGVDVNEKDARGSTVLMGAVENPGEMKETDAVKLLIHRGADVNARDKNGETALMLACRWRGLDKLVQLLLDYGADVNVRDTGGWTARMHAAYMGQTRVLELLNQHEEKK